MAVTSGIVFDIKEFAVHDGGGIRTTVFLKGCPLRCAWCHNPEGLSPEPQAMSTLGGTRISGQCFTPDALAEHLNKQAAILRANRGGVTFSGGEPLMQVDFLVAVIEHLDDMHVLLDTAGFAAPEDFMRAVGRCDMVYFDLKLMDSEAHEQWTGHGNGLILSNLQRLDESGLPYEVRVPLVPGVTDSGENLSAIARRIRFLRHVSRVVLLPYNRAAGGKYRTCGLCFEPQYDESRPVNADISCFSEVQVPVQVV